MTEDDLTLWQKVTATVTRFGEKRPNRRIAQLFAPKPKTMLDLHGLTVIEAHQATKEFIEEANTKTVTIVTGKSGQIRQEFERWLELDHNVRFWEEKNGGGAFTVWLRR